MDSGTEPGSTVELTGDEQKAAAVQISEVRHQRLTTEISVFGRVEEPESRLSTISARVAGRVDKLYLQYTGQNVQRGQAIVEIYSPELLSASEEYKLALVDAGIVMTENVLRQAEKFTQEHGDYRPHIWQITLDAARVVGRPIFFAMIIIILAFVPVFAPIGMEGKMFHPLAFTKTFAMIASTLMAVIECGHKEQARGGERQSTMAQRPARHWTIHGPQRPHYRIVILPMELSPDKERAENGYQRELEASHLLRSDRSARRAATALKNEKCQRKWP